MVTTTTSPVRRVAPFVVGIAICQTAGLIGSIFTRAGQREWFPSLDKPDFNPPAWVFGPVWTLLYAMMGIAAGIVWREGRETRDGRLGLQLFGLQLGLNTLWSALFFGARSPFTALIDIVALWIAIVATIVVFARTSRVAAVLMLPYLAWTTFATVLNATIWQINR